MSGSITDYWGESEQKKSFGLQHETESDGAADVHVYDYIWQHERLWSSTLNCNVGLCKVDQERDESLVRGCVGVSAFVKMKVLFWPQTLSHKHKLLFSQVQLFSFYEIAVQKEAHSSLSLLLLFQKWLFCCCTYVRGKLWTLRHILSK